MNPDLKQAENEQMKRVNRILNDEEFKERLSELNKLEKDRIFCRHGLDHLLSAARLAYIFSLERKCGLEKSLIYAAALLHDIGRGEEYKTGVSHDEAGGEIAGRILLRCEFSPEEIRVITCAIKGHRGGGCFENGASRLAEVLYDADKISRDCFLCGAKDECSWSDEKKNLSLLW